MSLERQLGFSLEAVAPDKALIARLLVAARRNIADAQLPGLSAENRFDAAYKAIMQMAMAALNANGYRTLTSTPGHHRTAIRSPDSTIGVPKATIVVLDALRKQRNLVDYSGQPIPDATAVECLASAQELLATLTSWLKAKRPELS